MKNFFYCFSFFISLCSSSQAIAQCNGFATLCQRRFNEVAYLTTHNAFNCQENNFSLPNQTWGITKQLHDGVRGLMIDVYDVGGVLTVYHGSSLLGSEPLSDVLDEIKAYLDSNQNEIISIILESYASASSIESALTQSGLMAYLFEKQVGTPWPVLQEMIDSGKRLVIFSEKNDGLPNQPWYHYIWEYAVETHFTVHDTAAFSCDFNRGDPNNELFILNHFITNVIGVGVPAQAQIANSNPYFINRALNCWQTQEKFPNFIAVDFYEKGSCMDVVNTLNGLSAKEDDKLLMPPVLCLFPNLSNDYINIEVGKGFFPPYSITIYDLQGQLLCNMTSLHESQITLSLKNLSMGLYILIFSGSKSSQYIYRFLKY